MNVEDLFPKEERLKPPVPPQGVMRPTQIFGVDPGDKFSGLAVVRTDPVLTVVAWGRPKNEDLFYFVASLAAREWWVWVESFRLYPYLAQEQSWSTFKTVEVIGVIRYLCRRKNIPFGEVSPSAAKTVMGDRELKKVFGIDNRGIRNQHALDALRVALYGAVVGKHETVEEQMKRYHPERAHKLLSQTLDDVRRISPRR